MSAVQVAATGQLGLFEAGTGACPQAFDTEAALRDFLTREAGRALKLTLTDNSSSMLSVRDRGSHFDVRLHRMFLRAGRDVLGELGRYIRVRKGGTPLFWEYVNSNQHLIEPKAPRRTKLTHRGAHHDLGEIFDRLNDEYFGSGLSRLITWGARAKRRARSRTLGSYTSSSGLIRISPALDRGSVPLYYLEFVVYHEMLHAALDREGRERAEKPVRKLRRRVHCPEFRRRERLFRHYDRAMAFEGRKGLRA